MGQDIYNSALEFSRHPSAVVLGVDLGISDLWLKLLGACVMQYVLFEISWQSVWQNPRCNLLLV